MRMPKNEARGKGAFAAPLLGVVLLLTCYILLTEWQSLPSIIGSAIAAVHWPV